MGDEPLGLFAFRQWHVPLTLIETRGEGGLFLCAPTPGYELMQGDFADLPVLTEAERELLLEAAWALNERVGNVVSGGSPAAPTDDGRPGDDFNQRGDVRDVLRRHGWTLAKPGENEYWRRPGKTSGWSATLKDKVFYVFSSSAAPFEPQQTYSPFAVYTLLEHGGDYGAAAAALRLDGFGGNGDDNDVDLSGIIGTTPCLSEPPSPPEYPNPGRMPVELLRVPGFVSAVMDHCLATAPYPNAALAFCGALALQAVIAGRKVRDQGDNGEADPVEPMDLVELERRMATVLPGGWRLGQIQAQQPATGYSEFKKEILNEIARCLSIPYNVAACNSSGYNYASGRLDHQTYYKSIRVDQAQLGIVVLDRVLRAWFDEAILVSELLPRWMRTTAFRDLDHQWFWDGQEHVDPAKEANAQATRLGNHTTTLAYEFARQGRDWESELRQRAKEVALVRELGLSEPQAPEPEESEPTDTQDTEQEEDDNATAHP